MDHPYPGSKAAFQGKLMHELNQCKSTIQTTRIISVTNKLQKRNFCVCERDIKQAFGSDILVLHLLLVLQTYYAQISQTSGLTRFNLRHPFLRAKSVNVPLPRHLYLPNPVSFSILASKVRSCVFVGVGLLLEV
jgi:hypothetical protein